MIRLLLVEPDVDRGAWLRLVLESRGFQVVGQARSGAGALREAGRCQPQVAAVAFDLPDFSGAETTRRIMENHPVPVVLLLDRESPEKVAAALEGSRSGATTVIEEPPPPGHPEHEERLAELVNTLVLMHEVPVVQRRPARRFAQARPDAPRPGSALPEIVGLAASTGGPAAVQAILQALPADFPLPILLVQHMSDGFASALVEWLDRTCPLHVVPAESGQVPQPGTVYVAAGLRHLLVREGPVLELQEGDPVDGHRPSATLMLQSLARVVGDRAIGVVLTGMGDDGVDGLLELRRRGGVTLAQDEQTSVVFGMPREALRRGAVQGSMSPPELAAALVRLSQGESGPSPAAEPDPVDKELRP